MWGKYDWQVPWRKNAHPLKVSIEWELICAGRAQSLRSYLLGFHAMRDKANPARESIHLHYIVHRKSGRVWTPFIRHYLASMPVKLKGINCTWEQWGYIDHKSFLSWQLTRVMDSVNTAGGLLIQPVSAFVTTVIFLFCPTSRGIYLYLLGQDRCVYCKCIHGYV